MQFRTLRVLFRRLYGFSNHYFPAAGTLVVLISSLRGFSSTDFINSEPCGFCFAGNSGSRTTTFSRRNLWGSVLPALRVLEPPLLACRNLGGSNFVPAGVLVPPILSIQNPAGSFLPALRVLEPLLFPCNSQPRIKNISHFSFLKSVRCSFPYLNHIANLI